MVRDKVKTFFHDIATTIAICELGDEWSWVVPQWVEDGLIGDDEKGLIVTPSVSGAGSTRSWMGWGAYQGDQGAKDIRGIRSRRRR